MKQFSRNNLTTIEREKVHSIILEHSCDIAETITAEICENRGILMYIRNEGKMYDDAQDIFNDQQDEIEEQLYNLVNSAFKAL